MINPDAVEVNECCTKVQWKLDIKRSDITKYSRVGGMSHWGLYMYNIHINHSLIGTLDEDEVTIQFSEHTTRAHRPCTGVSLPNFLVLFPWIVSGPVRGICEFDTLFSYTQLLSRFDTLNAICAGWWKGYPIYADDVQAPMRHTPPPPPNKKMPVI